MLEKIKEIQEQLIILENRECDLTSEIRRLESQRLEVRIEMQQLKDKAWERFKESF